MKVSILSLFWYSLSFLYQKICYAALLGVYHVMQFLMKSTWYLNFIHFIPENVTDSINIYERSVMIIFFLNSYFYFWEKKVAYTATYSLQESCTEDLIVSLRQVQADVLGLHLTQIDAKILVGDCSSNANPTRRSLDGVELS